VGVRVYVGVYVDTLVPVGLGVRLGVLVLVGLPPAVAVRVAVADGVTVTGVTISVALAGVEFVTPFPVINAPAGIILIILPGVLEVTSIATVQKPGVDPN
jgi:hypothetical protein